jgi:hypothetical protein
MALFAEAKLSSEDICSARMNIVNESVVGSHSELDAQKEIEFGRRELSWRGSLMWEHQLSPLPELYAELSEFFFADSGILVAKVALNSGSEWAHNLTRLQFRSSVLGILSESVICSVYQW